MRPSGLDPGQRISPTRLPGLPDDIEIGAIQSGRAQLVLFERGHWCVACRKHLIQLSAAIDEFARRNVEVVAVAHESLSDLSAAALRTELAFPIGVDTDLDMSEALGIVGIDEYGKRTIRPTAILLRTDGEIAFSYVGDDSIDRLSVPALLLAIDRLT